VKDLKDVKRRLIAELMKDSRRSDRELATALKVSQPTVSRTRSQLEKDGCIGEYTIVPDFAKLDYKILALTFVKLKTALTPEQIEQAKGIIKEATKTMTINLLMLERGLGLDSDGVIVSIHKDYSAYTEFAQLLTRLGGQFLLIESIKSFLIDLQDKVRFMPLTLSLLAQDLAREKTDDSP
jgi:DNA-binding Lrp family transcriptional regulator